MTEIFELIKRITKDKHNFFEVGYIPQVDGQNVFSIGKRDKKVLLQGDCDLSIATALGCYLKETMKIDWAWCGNREVVIDKDLVLPEKNIERIIQQKYRVYLNYCTFCYSMAFWDFERWEKEIDFMAMHGINMPLAVVGTEGVWYYTLMELGFKKEEALEFISGNAFWAWQLMTNIEGYVPPLDEKYIEDRVALGKQIIDREVALGMMPIQQGYSGHVPRKLKSYFPKANVRRAFRWCNFKPTAQLNPLDPMFRTIGLALLNKQKELFGSYHFYGCDPFHESIPPSISPRYLKKVGEAIIGVYKEFDSDAIWVMQSWSLRESIVKAVDKKDLLIMDINGKKCSTTNNFWGYNFVCGLLHNFGGNNSLDGNLEEVADNHFYQLLKSGANVVGTGHFMEAIEHTPIFYDLAFEAGISQNPIDIQKWLKDYLERRYGQFSTELFEALNYLVLSVYRPQFAHNNQVGSIVVARPFLNAKTLSCGTKICVPYNNTYLQNAVRNFVKVADMFKFSDGFQYDLCDLTRQLLSNQSYFLFEEIKKSYKEKNIEEVVKKSNKFLELLGDMNQLLSHRSELNFDTWLYQAQSLGKTEAEKKYFNYEARLLVTLWGDVEGQSWLYDYAWREWSGLIDDYYKIRWERFFQYMILKMKEKKEVVDNKSLKFPLAHILMNASEFGRQLIPFELEFVKIFKEVKVRPKDKDCTDFVVSLMKKYDL